MAFHKDWIVAICWYDDCSLLFCSPVHIVYYFVSCGFNKKYSILCRSNIIPRSVVSLMENVFYITKCMFNACFCLHWEMKDHESRVNLVKRFSKIYTRPVSFLFPNANKKCTSILIFMLKRQIKPKKSKKFMSVFVLYDQWHSLENICQFLMLHCRRMPLEYKYNKNKKWQKPATTHRGALVTPRIRPNSLMSYIKLTLHKMKR